MDIWTYTDKRIFAIIDSYWCCIDYFKLKIFIVWDNSILLKKHHLIDFLWTFPLRSLPLLDLLLASLGFLKLSCFRPFFTEPGNKKIGLAISGEGRWFFLFSLILQNGYFLFWKNWYASLTSRSSHNIW